MLFRKQIIKKCNRAKKPVITVCATRTGSGKSQTTRKVCQILKDKGKDVVVIRHPMPYGDLTRQVCQRFGKLSDLNKHKCTIEEREEYEPHILSGTVVYAGVDYRIILKEAKKEADVIVWDGGNNDLPFIKPDLHIVICDALRPGHELKYFPGEANFRMADVIIINKSDYYGVKQIEKNIKIHNPKAKILYSVFA